MSDRLRIVFTAVLFVFASLALPGLSHTVGPKDTLFSLSVEYGIPVQIIRRANNLETEIIRAGERLVIPTEGLRTITVQPGDTLSGLSLLLDIPQSEIAAFNQLEGDGLRVGQVLELPPPTPRGHYRVRPGDSLLGIALRYGISADQLKAYNGLDSDIIFPDQMLVVTAPRPEGHRVREGESLWSIAGKYALTMDEIRRWNSLDEEDYIHPGDLLALFPGLPPSIIADTKEDPSQNVALASIVSPARPAPDLPVEGEYFYVSPQAESQPTVTYWEGSTSSSNVDFRRAEKVMEAFENEISALPALSRRLQGWHVILDPGHGGLDPGAIVSVPDGNGNPLVITEDEYAYDVSLRVYRLLIRHGASVDMTILAPDHHIREGENPRITFVNKKSEVYADENHNENSGWRPVGTVDGLDMRKNIAADSIAEASPSERAKGTLFLSIHADNSSDLPAGTAILYDGADDEELERSKSLAAAMAPQMGAGSFIRQQNLRVLKNNPADAAVLVEARNIHYPRNAWALRSPELREQDARMITDGVLAWADR